MDIMKESIIEYIENIYALGITYLKNKNSEKLKLSLKELESLEDEIRMCNNINIFNGYVTILKSVIDKVEGIIYE